MSGKSWGEFMTSGHGAGRWPRRKASTDAASEQDPMTVSKTKITRPGLFAMGLGAVALIGWGAFAYSGESRAVVERELRAQIQQTEAERARRLEDRMQLKQELGAVQDQLRASRNEQSRAVRARDQTRAELVTAQQHLAAVAKRREPAREHVAPSAPPMPPVAPARIREDAQERVARADVGPPLLPPARIPQQPKERAR